MPSLAQSLEGQDFGHLLIVAESWGIDLRANDVRNAVIHLCEEIPDQIAKKWGDLPANTQTVLKELAAQGGRMAWAQFTRAFGEVREMGPGRRDKEQPHRHPVSEAERLWYRALVGRAFLDTAEGLQEFAFVPDDLLAKLPHAKFQDGQSFGRLARPEERAHQIPASDRILDEACTLLAGLRIGLSGDQLKEAEPWRMPIPVMMALLTAARILGEDGKPIPEATRRFLEVDRGKALALLARTWLDGDEVNDLRLMPGLIAEGNWENHPAQTRQKVVTFARTAPANQWWSISTLLADIKIREPDFQRQAGDYDSWYLRDKANGEYLRGFETWEAVDGALVAYLLRGPLHWLGFLDLGLPSEQPASLPGALGEEIGASAATAFRWSRWAEALHNGQAPIGLKVEGLRLKVDSRGNVFIPPLVPRTIRYVIARFCDWLPKQKDTYRYQITARALERARQQGLEARQLIGLLKSYSSSSLPPNLLQALKRWEQQGVQARIEAMQVLRLNSAGALKALRASRAARYLGEPLGPTSIAVKPGSGPQILQTLIELGYLGTLGEGE